ncbi:MAG: hypothetical protein ACLSA2_07900 [Candidatus Gastranaerophilaceae bacterium]
MQARRAARELAFILFSQFDKKITHYSKNDLEDIILKSVRILTSSATEIPRAVGSNGAMRIKSTAMKLMPKLILTDLSVLQISCTYPDDI